MGNNGSSLGDEPTSAVAQKNLQHFDHSFKGELHTVVGSYFGATFGEFKINKRPINIICKGSSFDIIEDVGISARKNVNVSYLEISAISWDHANSEVKLTINNVEEENFVILTMANSVEFEGELKLRFNGAAANSNKQVKIPSPMYIGMFAGATKPKPFQRKRPNLSQLPAGKLPTLHEMRNSAIDLHKGSYKPCANGESRRLEIALQHIYEGCNTFPLLKIRGSTSVSNQYRPDSSLIITDEMILFKPRGTQSEAKIEFSFEDIVDWNVIDNDLHYLHDSGIEIISSTDDKVFFGVDHIRDVKHTLEYFWNKYKVANDSTVKLGSTHGRPIVSVFTLSGDMAAPEAPVGVTSVVDQDGIVVRSGAKMVPRKSSLGASVIQSKEPKIVPPENRAVKKHWHKVVLHQGWLLKQGGVGVGTNKSWIKRYFVLYKTSQGHFLVYYSDFTECPLYTSEKHHRNVVDLAKATFIRPGSNKSETTDIPAYSFDIVTTEREWTLCAETQENELKWLKLITRAVDEDVAILPDEELLFKVKPKVDPLGVLPSTDYSTSLKVSANGISVCIPQLDSSNSALISTTSVPEREVYFWVYTDFYKWSLLSQAGKLALLVNVFADSSFSRRNEYIFRTKEAVRLATAIEYFIEKFMSVMHIRLETTEGAFDNVEAVVTKEEPLDKTAPIGMHQVNTEEAAEEFAGGGYQEELDLLGLEIDEYSSANKTQNNTIDPFGSDPFGSTTAEYESNNNDLLAYINVTATAPPIPIQPAPITKGFDDPFGSDPFGDSLLLAPPPPPVIKLAPPLTPVQVEQHKQWMHRAIATAGGPLYDDGTLQVASKVEIRGSQCRLSLSYRNQSPAALTDFVVTLTDAAGLIRFEITPLSTSTISGLGQSSQVIMLECIKPAAPGPKINFSYQEALLGKHSNTLDLPILVTSFNEPLSIGGEEFLSKWNQLTAQGQESQEILRPSYPIVPTKVAAVFSSIFNFGKITSGIPDISELVLYGASSLRTGALTPTGEKISVGCLAKIELNLQANAIRFTLRTLHPAATLSVLQTIKEIIV